jgi:hypothetical protein
MAIRKPVRGLFYLIKGSSLYIMQNSLASISRRYLFTSAINKARKPFSLTFALVGEDDEPKTLRSSRELTKYFSPYLFQHSVTGELRDAAFLAKSVNRPDSSVIYRAYHHDPHHSMPTKRASVIRLKAKLPIGHL